MIDQLLDNRRTTLGADKSYDTKDFVKDLRDRNEPPVIAWTVSTP